VYFAAIDWAFRMQHHQYISREIARAGGRVIFIENSGVRWPRLRDLDRVGARLRNLALTAAHGGSAVEPGITVVPPRVLPVHPARVVRALNRWALLRQIRGAAPDLHPSSTIAWVGLPNWTSYDVARALRPRTTVYYNADEFARVPGAHPTIRASEAAVIRAADIVFVTSQRLRRLCEREGKRPVVVPVGVDVAEFIDAAARRLPKPADLASLPGRVIGYMGGVNHKLDPRLLEAVATAFPTDTVVVLGPVEDRRALPRGMANIRLLGERPHDDLPAYLQHFDVCLIPYVRSEFTDSVYPAKLNEYLAAGRPVVSTALPEVRAFAGIVYVATTTEEFIAKVAEALSGADDLAAAERRAHHAAKSAYPALVSKMLAELHDHLGPLSST
jgi:glycosyltransferase involved in cell wall biosynthesis